MTPRDAYKLDAFLWTTLSVGVCYFCNPTVYLPVILLSVVVVSIETFLLRKNGW